MSFDFDEMLRSKQALRQRLTSLPIAEKLRLLDELRQRAVAIRSAGSNAGNVVREEPATYKPKEWNR
jgi:hypothetical protein